jgi:hypothetical protein
MQEVSLGTVNIRFGSLADIEARAMSALPPKADIG